jgi:hypothetical protein
VASKTRPFFSPLILFITGRKFAEGTRFPFWKTIAAGKTRRKKRRGGDVTRTSERSRDVSCSGEISSRTKKRSAFFSGTFFWSAFIPSPTQQVSTSCSLWWFKKQGTHTSKMTIHPQFYYYKSIGEMMYHPRFQIMGTVYSKYSMHIRLFFN